MNMANKAATKYQEKCEIINDEFHRIFIEKNINFRRDVDSACVKEFIQTKNIRVSNISFEEGSVLAGDYEDMAPKTKALYM